jgi:hypothetical protein
LSKIQNLTDCPCCANDWYCCGWLEPGSGTLPDDLPDLHIEFFVIPCGYCSSCWETMEMTLTWGYNSWLNRKCWHWQAGSDDPCYGYWTTPQVWLDLCAQTGDDHNGGWRLTTGCGDAVGGGHCGWDSYSNTCDPFEIIYGAYWEWPVPGWHDYARVTLET